MTNLEKLKKEFNELTLNEAVEFIGNNFLNSYVCKLCAYKQFGKVCFKTSCIEGLKKGLESEVTDEII